MRVVEEDSPSVKGRCRRCRQRGTAPSAPTPTNKLNRILKVENIPLTSDRGDRRSKRVWSVAKRRERKRRERSGFVCNLFVNSHASSTANAVSHTLQPSEINSCRGAPMCAPAGEHCGLFLRACKNICGGWLMFHVKQLHKINCVFLFTNVPLFVKI